MNRLVLFVAMAMACLGFSLEIIPITDFEKNEELSKTLKSQDLKALQGKIIKVPKGYKIPLKMVIQGDFFSLKAKKSPMLKIQKDFFISVEDKGQFLFSIDGKTWRSAEQFFCGNFHAGLGIESDRNTFFTLSADLNLRN